MTQRSAKVDEIPAIEAMQQVKEVPPKDGGEVGEVTQLRYIWGIVKIMVPFWVPIIIRGRIRGLI